MNLVKGLLKRFSSLRFNQDYVCLDSSKFPHQFKIYVVDGNTIERDITYKHCFVGYSPLVFAILKDERDKPNIRIVFSDKVVSPNEKFHQKDAVAFLDMKKIHSFPGDNFEFFEGVLGKHRFIRQANQVAISLSDRLYNRKPGNVFLPGNLLKQVHIAYSFPRVISLITVGKHDLFNLFPTDLHGQMGNKYIISLRHNGKACSQVVEMRNIVLSEIAPSQYREVYHLGKNHMREFQVMKDLPFDSKTSPIHQLPLPIGANRFRELALCKDFIHGIHRIMVFDIVNTAEPASSQGTLSHVHNIYASWLWNKGIRSNYLLR